MYHVTMNKSEAVFSLCDENVHLKISRCTLLTGFCILIILLYIAQVQ